MSDSVNAEQAAIQPVKKSGKLKKILLFAGGGFATFILLAIGAVFFASESKLKAQIDLEAAAFVIPEGNDDVLARGKYLVDHIMGCGHSDCHRADFGGGAVMDNFPMGLIYAPNITSGEGGVIKDYEPVDWIRILRHGIRKDGRRALVMPSEDYVTFSDEDLGAVVAYIKSQPAVDRASPRHSLGPIARMLLATGEVTFAYDKIDHSAERPNAVPGPTAEWGSVLIGACIGCHGGELSGGKIPGGDPSWPAPRNITPHETGIAGWSFDDFNRTMREGKRPDGTDVHPLMPWQAYAGMTEDDIRALWEHLQTVPPKPEGGR
jgi:mono/diheme cytochrome c family protein